MDHLRELRTRFLLSSLALIVIGTVTYFFYQPIIEFLRAPLGQMLYYSSPTGNFSFIMKICLMGAITVAMPVLVYNLIMFVRPAFDKIISKKQINLISLSSGALAIAGAAFGFYVILPGSLNFFSSFQTNGISALITADSYLNFVTNIIITFVIVFQLPLLINFIDTIKPLSPSKMLKWEKWVILGSLIVSVIVPFAFDLITTLLIALPIVVLYNIALVTVIAKHASVTKKEKARAVAGLFETAPNSNLTELSFEELLDDEIPVAHSYAPHAVKRAGMDIVPTSSPQEPVSPAAWVYRVHAPIPLNPRAKVISDIQRVRVPRGASPASA